MPPRRWILVSLRRRRLFLFEGDRVIRNYPVGLGRTATQTPRGEFKIINKVPWPDSYPGGPLTVYGTFWMGLSAPHYGIHGTNNPASIGKYVSHGCIRMYNRDVEQLASLVSIGTEVKIRPN
ncbi:L,D-transpeptidase [Brevibacillus dissolubilis]|uniref:L,D-transpeptidase n=1 Tax=Brevibacillus dissolubilis TaxID=1844116 RepID=UPI001116C2CD|nr:L,D-transpeptidase [Brevibacillus dissolubilis]